MHDDLDTWADQAIEIANNNGDAYWQTQLHHPTIRRFFARLEQEMDTN